MNACVLATDSGATARDASRHEVAPWARLVLSLLLLGAPALAVGVEAGRDTGFLASALEQLQLDAQAAGDEAVANVAAVSTAPQPLRLHRWQLTLRRAAVAVRVSRRLHLIGEPSTYAHGRVIDPAFYLQRTPR